MRSADSSAMLRGSVSKRSLCGGCASKFVSVRFVGESDAGGSGCIADWVGSCKKIVGGSFIDAVGIGSC